MKSFSYLSPNSMREFILLLGVLFKQGYRTDPIKKKKKIAYIVTAAVCLIPIIALICVFMYFYANIAYSEGLSAQFISFVSFTGMIIVFFFGIFSIMNYMFLSKDAEFLSALPTRRSTLFLAKLAMVYFNEILLAALFLFPTLIVTGIAINGGFVYFVLILPAVLLLPLIPLLILSILAFPLMYIVAFFKDRSALSAVVLMLLFAGVMAGYYALIANLYFEEQDAIIMPPALVGLMQAINTYFYPIPWLASIMAGTGAWYEIIFFLLSVTAVFALSVFICSKLYFKGVMAQTESPDSIKRKNTELNSTPILRALIRKEFSELIKNPSFAFNSFMGAILTPVLIVVMNTAFSSFSGEIVTDTGGNISLIDCGMVIFYSMMLLCGTNYGATAAFTREGKSFYINKILPVDPSTIVKAKLILADIITGVGVILTTAVVMIFTKIGIINGILFGIALAIFCFGFNAIGVKRDLKKPKLNWNNANEAIKNNFYMAVPLLISMGIGMLILVTGMLAGMLITGTVLASIVFWGVVFVMAFIVFFAAGASSAESDYELFERIEP